MRAFQSLCIQTKLLMESDTENSSTYLHRESRVLLHYVYSLAIFILSELGQQTELRKRKNRGLDISPENCHCIVVSLQNCIRLLSSFPVLLQSPKQLDSAHNHQLDIPLIKPSDKQAWALFS